MKSERENLRKVVIFSVSAYLKGDRKHIYSCCYSFSQTLSKSLAELLVAQQAEIPQIGQALLD
jgi:hypothetical protein